MNEGGEALNPNKSRALPSDVIFAEQALQSESLPNRFFPLAAIDCRKSFHQLSVKYNGYSVNSLAIILLYGL